MNKTPVASTARLGLELLDILWEYLLLQDHLPPVDDPFENLKRVTMAQLLTGDIVLRLCKFRDADTRSLGFEQVVKELRKRPALHDRVAGIEPLLKEYRHLTTNLQRHRDTYVAHVSKDDRRALKPLLEIRKSIQLAVTVVDQLVGEPCKYDVQGKDLRREVTDGAA